MKHEDETILFKLTARTKPDGNTELVLESHFPEDENDLRFAFSRLMADWMQESMDNTFDIVASLGILIKRMGIPKKEVMKIVDNMIEDDPKENYSKDALYQAMLFNNTNNKKFS